VITTLEGTTSAKISAALLRARRTSGSPAQGMVLTLIVVCDEEEYAQAMEASMAAGREHPSRILLVVTGAGRTASLDAEVHIGEGTPGEVVVVRMRGAVAAHPASVIRPLLLPDSPVVIWWPGKVPSNRAADELGQLAMRRLTDAASAARPLTALRARARDYTPGDSDLSWTRLTPWRALLAAALDQYPSSIKSATPGPGITAVRMTTPAGDIAITRADGLLASYTVPGQPERLVALKRRDFTELISEELRRMDPDQVFERTLLALVADDPPAKKAPTQKVTTQKAAKKVEVS
jgi:glucose-6-phosphate dehydrogenase assembly protein OpcA